MYFNNSLRWSTLGLILTAAVSAAGQSNVNWSEWETLTPDGEEFSVVIPKGKTVESTKFQYHKMQLTSRLYMAADPKGAVFAVVSLNGIRSNPAAYTELERFNSYVNAFKDWFPAKARTTQAAVKLTLNRNTIFHGYNGREYQLTIGDLSGVAQTYITRKRFYALVALNTKKDEALKEKFLSSFLLPDRSAEPVAMAAAQTGENPGIAPQPQGTRTPATPTDNKRTEGEAENPGTPPKTPDVVETTPDQQPKRQPISGGVLNGKAIYLPMPAFPPGDAQGTVIVQVLIDEQGFVAEAKAISGPQALHAAAVTAARLARFSPTTLMGEPVRVTGVITYNFTRQ
ncbi:MAG: energy transducer TonB [Pyrinomonadaceae bacterium]